MSFYYFGFTSGYYKKELKESSVLSLPLIAALLSQKGIGVVNTIMMGMLGIKELAAGALGDSLFSIFMAFGFGALSAVGVLIARSAGEKKDSNIGKITYNGIYLAFIFSIIFIFILWYTPQFLLLIKQNPGVVYKTKEYLHSIVWGLPALLGFFILQEFSAALNHPKVITAFSLLGIPVVAILNYIFAFGKLGFPALGIAGIGFSTAIVQWLTFIGMYIYLLYHKDIGRYLRITSTKDYLTLKYFKEILTIGCPAGFTFVLELGMLSISAIMMGYFGVVVLAAHQIVLMSTTIFCRFPLAISITTAIRVSKNVGLKKFRNANLSVYINLFCGFIICAVSCIFFFFFPEFIVNIFISSNDANFYEVLSVATILFYFGAVVLLLDSFQTILNGALRGMKDTFIPMIFCLTSYWLFGVGGSYTLAFILKLDEYGVWGGLVLGLSVSSILLYLRYLNTHKKLAEPITT
ncbi:MAG TPA: MATE family efflux transporter [Victivallales bacterium]|nr:MATE family efflux transporter [Victivallales bacterium]